MCFKICYHTPNIPAPDSRPLELRKGKCKLFDFIQKCNRRVFDSESQRPRRSTLIPQGYPASNVGRIYEVYQV